MTSAIIINAYSVRNAGDAAIMLASSNLLHSMGFHQVDVSSRHWNYDSEFYDRFTIGSVPPPVPFPTSSRFGSVGRLVSFALGIVWTSLFALLYRLAPALSRTTARAFRLDGIASIINADCVVLAGGGYVYSAKRRINLSLVHALIQVRIASFMGKKVIMMPQSIGPLTKRMDVALAQWAMRDICPIVVRDAQSVRAGLRQLQRLESDIILLPDIVFYGLPETDSVPSLPYPNNQSDILVVTMDWTWARETYPNSLESYIQKLAGFIDEMVDKGRSVTLAGNSRMPEQGQDDFAIARRVLSATKSSQSDKVSILDDQTDLLALQHAMRNVRMVVGTRLHSCILALTLGIPTLALAYQPKTQGTYELLDMPEYCFDVESFTSKELVDSADYILSTYDQESIRIQDTMRRTAQDIADFYLAPPLHTTSKAVKEGQLTA